MRLAAERRRLGRECDELQHRSRGYQHAITSGQVTRCVVLVRALPPAGGGWTEALRPDTDAEHALRECQVGDRVAQQRKALEEVLVLLVRLEDNLRLLLLVAEVLLRDVRLARHPEQMLLAPLCRAEERQVGDHVRATDVVSLVERGREGYRDREVPRH